MAGKGQPKTGGRKKGVATLASTLREELVKNNFDVLKKFIEVFPHQENQGDLLLKLMHYIYPVPKDTGFNFDQMTIEQLKQMGGLVLETIRSRTNELMPEPRKLDPATTGSNKS